MQLFLMQMPSLYILWPDMSVDMISYDFKEQVGLILAILNSTLEELDLAHADE